MITGRGRYLDDITVPGVLYIAFVRSPEAHATISSIDKSTAEAHEDVVAVFTGEDLAGDLVGPMPMAWAPPGVEIKTPENWALSRGEVKHVGDPVAVVVGTDRYSVVDAAEQVMVEYEPKPVVVDPEKALEDGGALVWEQFGTNKSHEYAISGGDVEQAFAEADVVVEQRMVNHRTAGAPIEPRGVLADPHGDSVTLYSATQIPHILRLQLAGIVGMPEDQLRVIAPDVGGGFGSKLQVYPEEAIALVLARRLQRPVKWIETRTENMMVAHHGRDQINYIQLAAKRDGTLLGCKARVVADFGAYFLLLTPFIPELGFPVMGGCYKIPAIDVLFEGAFTNKFCTDAIRGAGRPEATYWIELIMDKLADELGMDSARAAAQELHRQGRVPVRRTRSGSSTTRATTTARSTGCSSASTSRRSALSRRRCARRASTAGSASRRTSRCAGWRPRARWDRRGSACRPRSGSPRMVRVHPSGSATVYTGASPHGQGHDTGFAQIAADRLGIDPQRIEVVHGDTGTGPWGWGTYGSRSLSVGGEAVARAAEKVQEKAKRITAALLEAAPEDIELVDGKFQVRGSPDKAKTMADIAFAAHVPPQELPTDIEPGLEETSFYDPENFVFPFGAHACVVEVDPETGKVKVVQYVAVDDCGPAINPMLIDGQVHGGVVHAIGQALYERVHYDADGQLVTSTFVDYAIPTAAEMPAHRDRPHGDALAGELAGRQGDRRSWDDRGHAGGDLRRARRLGPARGQVDGHAALADASVGGDTGRFFFRWRCSVIPPAFEYVAPDVG